MRKNMKMTNALILIMVLIAFLASCSENPGTTTMKLILSTDVENGSRTLLPSDSTLLDVTKYTITGTGPNGKTFTKNTDSNSVAIEGLVIGTWTVFVKGLNREGTELVSGSTTFNLTASSGPKTVVLNTLVGTGTFSFVLDWSLCDVLNPGMEVYLTGPDMDSDEVPLFVEMNTSAKRATVSETLAAGSYKVRAILTDGGQQVAGLVEAVRISNGTSTTGTHTFHFSELGPTVLAYFIDATGTPIKGTLSMADNPETFLDGGEYTCVFGFTEPDKVDTDGLSIDWYYDGNRIGDTMPITMSGSTVSVTVSSGVHRIDAVVYNKLRGSTGSAAYTFTVVPDGKPGEMALLNADAGSAVSPDAGTIISPLPGDMFLVTVPDSARMNICAVSGGSLQVLKTYDASNFAWLGSTRHVFSDSAMDFIIVTDNYGGRENFTVLRFNRTSNTLEEVVGMRYEGSVSTYGIPFTNFTAAAFNPERGFIYLSDAGRYGYDYFFTVSGNTIALSGTITKKSGTYYNVADMDVSADGSCFVWASEAATRLVSARTTDRGTLTDATESQEAPGSLRYARFVNNQTVVAGNAAGLWSFKVVPAGSYTTYRDLGISVADIAADGDNYFYVADNSSRIVSFEASGYEVTQLGFTELDAPVSRICLSGKYLAVLTEQNTIAMFKVIE